MVDGIKCCCEVNESSASDLTKFETVLYVLGEVENL